jgi:hypothetical protein
MSAVERMEGEDASSLRSYGCHGCCDIVKASITSNSDRAGVQNARNKKEKKKCRIEVKRASCVELQMWRYHECENFLCLVLEACVAIVKVGVEERLQDAHVLSAIE